MEGRFPVLIIVAVVNDRIVGDYISSIHCRRGLSPIPSTEPMRRGLERIKAFLNRCMLLPISVGILLAEGVKMVDQPVVVFH
jgi:hypothetical protein